MSWLKLFMKIPAVCIISEESESFSDILSFNVLIKISFFYLDFYCL